ncbi:MAG: helix-turn-helix domain-containing protein [Alphaproteobacteria bacterium]|nr:helix-turn-helix domain-containing protein [Alphaproteobacteria bacterium]
MDAKSSDPGAAKPARSRGRPPSGKTAQPSSVQALDRALHILEVVAEADGLTLTEIGNLAGIAPSTAHRLLMTLQGRRFVQVDGELGQWVVGVGAFGVGMSFLRSRKLVTMGRGVMHALMESSGETANLGVEDEGEVVFISQVETHEAMRAFFRPGRRGAIHASGIGKALLAAMPDERVRALVGARVQKVFTANTLTSVKSLLADLGEIRARGWSLDNEEHTLGMRCIASVVYNEYGEAIAGVSISGPTVRVTDKRLTELGEQVRKASLDITAAIGGLLPDVG